MNFKKIISAVAAAAVAVSMMAANAFAATVAMDSEYPGAWGASATIPKAEFAAVGGDVKVVLTVETKEPLVGQHNHLAKPMNICSSWDAITDSLTSDTAIAKNDGFFVFAEGQTTLEFVVPESVWTSFVPYADEEGDGSAGLAFQVCDVIIKSAELSSGSAQGEIRRVDEAQSSEIMEGKSYEEVTGAAPAADEAPAVEETPAVEDAPAADATAEAPAATGNTPAAAVAIVMVAAGAAAVVSKRK
ncbi:MAG: hypothetical protein ACI4Q6_09160 [Huintestinicola sp.]